VAYGKVNLRELQSYELLILEGAHYGHAELKKVRYAGQVRVAYLSTTEVNMFAPYFSQLKDRCLGLNPHWNSRYLNPGDSEVRRVLLGLVEGYRAMGFDGLFLDTLDNTGSFGPLKHFRSALIDLLEELRTLWPEGIFIQNSGVHLPYHFFNLLLRESVLSAMDLTSGAWRMREEREQGLLLKTLQSYREHFILLEYANTEPQRHALETRMRELGCTGTVANLSLQGVPKFIPA
jgi:endo-alpha-1,4-polygalactosaminidase (GH114 family)